MSEPIPSNPDFIMGIRFLTYGYVGIGGNGDGCIMTLYEGELRKLYHFALKRTSDKGDAEELAQEIVLAALISLAKGSQPDDRGAWLWGIARHKAADWAERKRRYRERCMWDSEPLSAIGSQDSIEDGVLMDEEVEAVRQGLAYLSKEYREITVAYYIRNLRIADISKKTGLAEGTVKGRLYKSRQAMREGLEMGQRYGQRSFAPEEIRFRIINSGKGPGHLVDDLMNKNILLQAYGNPSTCGDLSLELGVPMPYMEDAVGKLTSAGLLRVIKGDKHVTDFMIIDRSTQELLNEKARKTVEELTDAITVFTHSTVDTVSIMEKASMTDSWKGTNQGGIWDRLVMDEFGIDPGHLRTMREDWKAQVGEAAFDAFTGSIDGRLKSWKDSTGNKTRTGGLTAEEFLWFMFPKTIDDAIYTALSSKGIGWSDTWEIYGMEGADTPMRFTLGRNNTIAEGLVLVGYVYTGGPGMPEYKALNDREAALMLDLMKSPRPMSGMDPICKGMAESLIRRGLLEESDDGIYPTFPVFWLPGIESFEGCFINVESPPFIKEAQVLGERMKGLWTEKIVPGISDLIDEYESAIRASAPEHLHSKVPKATVSMIFRIREHIWSHAMDSGYVRIPSNPSAKTLGMCMYVTE